jgi:hypothetical protein
MSDTMASNAWTKGDVSSILSVSSFLVLSDYEMKHVQCMHYTNALRLL